MILLLCNCSSSWCQSNLNDTIPLTGEEVQTDSVLVPISAIRVANVKMIELKYEQEINKNLRNVIQTDSILISSISTNLSACELNCISEVNKVKKQRNIFGGISGGLLMLLIIALF